MPATRGSAAMETATKHESLGESVASRLKKGRVRAAVADFRETLERVVCAGMAVVHVSAARPEGFSLHLWCLRCHQRDWFPLGWLSTLQGAHTPIRFVGETEVDPGTLTSVTPSSHSPQPFASLGALAWTS